VGSSGWTSSGLPSICPESTERRLLSGNRRSTARYVGGREKASMTLVDGESSRSEYPSRYQSKSLKKAAKTKTYHDFQRQL